MWYQWVYLLARGYTFDHILLHLIAFNGNDQCYIYQSYYVAFQL
jgi:hypothetical protein